MINHISLILSSTAAVENDRARPHPRRIDLLSVQRSTWLTSQKRSPGSCGSNFATKSSETRRQLTLSCNTSKICQNNGKTAHLIALKLLTTATYDARPVTFQKTLSVCSWVVFSLEVPWWPRLVLFVIQAPYRLHGLTRVLTKGQMLLAIHVVTTNSTHQNCTYVLHVSHV